MAVPNNASRREVSLNHHSASATLARIILAVGDLLTLLAFSYIGQREHETINRAWPFLGVLWTAFPFAVCWLAAGWLLGAYQVEGMGRRVFLGRSLNSWLVAAPLGVLLRAYLLERAVIPTVFLTAGLGFGGGMIVGWRLLFGVWYRRGVKGDA